MHIHRYGKWVDKEEVKFYDSVFSSRTKPVSVKLIQVKQCVCGKKKSRRVRV